MDNQLIQWLPLFGFGSVLTILIAIIGVGVGLWRNAGPVAMPPLAGNIDDLRMEIRGVQVGNAERKSVASGRTSERKFMVSGLPVRTDIQGVQDELSDLRTETRTDIQACQGSKCLSKDPQRGRKSRVSRVKCPSSDPNRMDGPIGSERTELSELRKDVSGLANSNGQVHDRPWVDQEQIGRAAWKRKEITVVFWLSPCVFLAGTG